MDDYLEKFKRELKIANYAYRTIKIYSSLLKKFFDFTDRNKKYSPEERIPVFLDKFTDSSEQRRLAYLSIKAFYEHVLKKECPYKKRLISSRKRIPIVLEKDDILKILNCIKNNNHYLMIAMMYGSGLRVSEVPRIKVSDLDFDNLKLRVRKSKNNKDRITLLSANIIDELKNIIFDKGKNDFIFITRSKNTYNIRTIQMIFKKALLKSGVKKNATCHTLRHSFATHLLNKGTNIKIIMNLMGHKNIKTTMIYLHISSVLKDSTLSPL
jgi:integrase/recombinase XerD